MNSPHSATVNTVKLACDRLEERDVPAAAVTLAGSTLTITGDAAANLVVVADDGQGNITAKVTTGGVIVSGGGKNVHAIVIDTGAGDDSVDYRLNKNLLVAEDLDIDLGAGNDRVRIDLYRGLSGVALDLDLDGGAGRDSAEVRFGAINNSKVGVTAALGADADRLDIVMFSGASGKSHVAFDVAGNSGADRVDFNLIGKIDAASTLDIKASNAVDADDRLVLRYKGELDGKMNVAIDRAAAVYGVQARFALAAGSTGKLTASVIDAKKTYKSTIVITGPAIEEKVTMIDRLGRHLTQPDGTKVTYIA